MDRSSDRPALFHFGALWRVQVLVTGSGLRDIQFIRPDLPAASASGVVLLGLAQSLQRAVLPQRHHIFLPACLAPQRAAGSNLNAAQRFSAVNTVDLLQVIISLDGFSRFAHGLHLLLRGRTKETPTVLPDPGHLSRARPSGGRRVREAAWSAGVGALSYHFNPSGGMDRSVIHKSICGIFFPEEFRGFPACREKIQSGHKPLQSLFPRAVCPVENRCRSEIPDLPS